MISRKHTERLLSLLKELDKCGCEVKIVDGSSDEFELEIVLGENNFRIKNDIYTEGFWIDIFVDSTRDDPDFHTNIAGLKDQLKEIFNNKLDMSDILKRLVSLDDPKLVDNVKSITKNSKGQVLLTLVNGREITIEKRANELLVQSSNCRGLFFPISRLAEVIEAYLQ